MDLNVEDVKQQLNEAVDFVINDVRQKWKELSGGPSIIEALKAFAAAVDWTERWILGLLAAQALLLVTAIVGRRSPKVQGAVFFTAMLVIYNCERLNSLAARHWKSFSSQNYFDPQGIFASALLSAPLLVTMFAVLVNYLLQSASLLIKLKRQELRYRRRQAAREAAGADAAGAGGAAQQEGKKER